MSPFSLLKRGLVLLSFLWIQFALAENPAAVETTLPLLFNSGNPSPDGMPSTVITIEGRQIPILVDSGAKKTTLALSPKAIHDLHLQFTGTSSCSKNLYSPQNCGKEFILHKITLGNFTLYNIKASLMDKAPWDDKDFQKTAASENGMIGFALLKQFNFLLDYPHSKMVLTTPGHIPQAYDLKKWTKMSFIEQFLTKMQLNNQQIIVSWDTGAIPSVIRGSLGKQFPTTQCPGNKRYSRHHCRSIAGNLTTQENEVLPNTWFRLTPFPDYVPFDALIGANFFEKNLVYFDFDQQQILVAPPEKK